jgi:hypothetical protein
MDEDRFNMELRKFLKEVGVTSQREIERIAREAASSGRSGPLRLKMVLSSADVPRFEHVVERTIEIG